MPETSMNAVLRCLRNLVAGKAAQGQTDQFLLERFVSQHDEAAFTALLQRHGPMTLAGCQRILQDEHLAEDAFQATFLVLALKAGAIRRQASVASWLYGVALRLARKLKAKTIRSRKAMRQNSPSWGRFEIGPESAMPNDPEKHEEHEILDEELQRLPEKYRLPLLLCYIEGRTREEAAKQLGWTLAKLKGLLDRGRDRLRSRLTRRGVTLSAATSATLLAHPSKGMSVMVPRSLADSTIQACFNIISGKTLAECGVSASVVTLVKGGLVMSAKKMLMILALVLLTGAVAVGAGIWTGAGQDGAPRSAAIVGERREGGEPAAKENLKQQQPASEQQKPKAPQVEPPVKENPEKKKKEDDTPELSEPVIDRLIEVLKNPKASLDERGNACTALSARSDKTKRAAPAMIGFFEELLKMSFPLNAQLEEKKCQESLKAAANGLGKIGTAETLACLIRAGGTTGNSEADAVRMLVVTGLAHIASGGDDRLKAKAKAELQLFAETDVGNPKELARKKLTPEKEDAKKDGDSGAVEEAFIDRVAELLKDPKLFPTKEDERYNTANRKREKLALLVDALIARSGNVAVKKAGPAMIGYFDELLAKPGPANVNFYYSKQLYGCANALGKIATPETFACLLKACRGEKELGDRLDIRGASTVKASQQDKEMVRMVAFKGLAHIAWGGDDDLKAKAKLELQVLAETAPDEDNKKWARRLLKAPYNLTLEKSEIELTISDGDDGKPIRDPRQPQKEPKGTFKLKFKEGSAGIKNVKGYEVEDPKTHQFKSTDQFMYGGSALSFNLQNPSMVSISWTTSLRPGRYAVTFQGEGYTTCRLVIVAK